VCSLGFDSVRMVAIDEDWSALRFRRVEFIKSSTK
jgi:aryl carrier-like protein